LGCCGMYEVPEQDPKQWIDIIRDVLNNQVRYEELAQRSYDTANQYVERLDNSMYEKILSKLHQSKMMK